MQPITAFLLLVSAAGVAACGEPDKAAAPEPAVAEAPAAPPVETAAPLVENAAPATVAAAEATPAASATAAPPPVATVPQPPAPPVAAPGRDAAAASVADLVHGQTIYRQACAFCHDKGVAGAPKTGDAAAWSARIAQGVDTLRSVAVKGRGAMPAKGGNPALGEADVHAAVDFMIAQSR